MVQIHTRQISFRIPIDIYDKLKNIPNRSLYLRDLIEANQEISSLANQALQTKNIYAEQLENIIYKLITSEITEQEEKFVDDIIRSKSEIR